MEAWSWWDGGRRSRCSEFGRHFAVLFLNPRQSPAHRLHTQPAQESRPGRPIRWLPHRLLQIVYLPYERKTLHKHPPLSVFLFFFCPCCCSFSVFIAYQELLHKRQEVGSFLPDPPHHRTPFCVCVCDVLKGCVCSVRGDACSPLLTLLILLTLPTE